MTSLPQTRAVSPRTSGRKRQRGAVVLFAALGISTLLIMASLIDLGLLYQYRREYQKAADLASMSGARVLRTSCATATGTANETVTLNLRGRRYENVIIECGSWDDTQPNAAARFQAEANAADQNAVRVQIRGTPPRFLARALAPGEAGRIRAEAIASLSQPVATFTVGSRLISVDNDGLLPLLLGAVGVNLTNADILSYQGLANVSIKPSGLLQALGIPVDANLDVGSLRDLVNVQNLTLGGLLDLTATVLQAQGQTAQVGLTLLHDLTTRIAVGALNLPLQLFASDSAPGVLLALETASAAALDANVNLLSLVTTSIAVATGDHLVDIPNLSVPLLGVAAKVTVVEPPAIGIGPVGTEARSSQGRVYLRINTASSPLGPILGVLGTQVDLPLIIELAQATGRLEAIQCSDDRKSADISVRSSPVNICLGRFRQMGVSDNNNDNFFHPANGCAIDEFGHIPDSSAGVRRHRILNALGILPLNVRVGLPLLEASSPVEARLYEPLTPTDDGASTATVGAANLDLARAAGNIVDAITVGILGDLLGEGISATPAQRGAIADRLVGTGNGGAGRSVSEVVNELQWSQDAMERLGDRMANGGLTGLLGGVLQGVGNLLNTVLVAPLVDIGCGLAVLGGVDAVRQCRSSYIRDVTLQNGSNILGSVLSIVLAILEPLLSPLGAILQGLLSTLGINLGQADVTLESVSCDAPQLVR